jgi:hypothetical protein
LDNGSTSGELQTAADYCIDFDDVRLVSLFEWALLLQQVELPGGHRLDITTLGTSPSEMILISPLPDGRLRISVIADATYRWDADAVKSLVAPVFSVNGDDLTGLEYDQDAWIFEASCIADDRNTQQLVNRTETIRLMLSSPEGVGPAGGLRADSILRVLVAGAGAYLLGLAESEWLEVKASAYDLDSFADRVELGQDISRFANASEPALLVLGYRTRRKEGRDVIVKLVPVQLPENAVMRYRSVIEQFVYPLIEGLQIYRLAVEGGHLLAIVIPAQPESRKPYLVHGAVVNNRNEGTFISIIQRRGEGSKSLRIEEIHALLVAGRATLYGRRGEE